MSLHTQQLYSNNQLPMKISVIIPTLNEASNITPLIDYIYTHWWAYIHTLIVVDGWSKDDTVSLAEQAWAIVLNSPPSRAKQMNLGAAHARDIYTWTEDHYIWFVHADVRPPESFAADIYTAVQWWATAWCFMTRYDTTDQALLKTTTNRTKYDHRLFRMWGQTLRMKSDDFWNLWWYDESMIVCEEIDLFRKIYKNPDITFHNIKKEILVSARKHEINGVHRTNFIYLCIYIMYRLGFSQQAMIRFYTWTIKSDRLATSEEYTTITQKD